MVLFNLENRLTTFNCMVHLLLISFFCTLIITYKLSFSNFQDSNEHTQNAFFFQNNLDKIANNQLNKVSKEPEDLKIVAVESDIDLNFMNVKVVKKIIEPKIEPIIADITEGVMKFATDPKTGKRFIPHQNASFKGGMDSFYVSITKQIKFKSELGLPNYRYENGDDEINYEINTVVFIECVVTATGKLDSVKLFKGASDPKFNERVLEAFRNSDSWQSALHEGRKINQKMIIPFHFDYKQPLIK